MKNKTYKHWELFDSMPVGWKLDTTCGSPLAGYEFITDGRSMLNGGKRALLRVRRPQQKLCLDVPAVSKMETTTAAAVVEKIEHPYPARTVNELARERFKLRLLHDIRCDLMICELEGWGKMEYINEMKQLINEIGRQV